MNITWEEAVKELRSKPENKQAVLDNYFDADIDGSVERFYNSEEFTEVMKFVPSQAKTLLDIGAGRGMASYAFAKKGLSVTALEPDTSKDVGAGAIQYLSDKHALNINVVATFGEQLPFLDNSFDVVYVRQVLHHAADLKKMCSEVFRVLKPGGVFIATREHVLSKESDLNQFLDKHPLHHLYGGEHAYTLSYYKECINASGLKLTHVLHPFSSVINYAPFSKAEMKAIFAKILSKVTGSGIAGALIRNNFVYKTLLNLKAASDSTPGRVYSFICVKPS